MCGIVGVYGAKKAAELTVIGLHANQHRARDKAGVVSTDGHHMYRERIEGVVRNFTAEMLDRLHGRAAVGHIRYPTVSDDKTRDNTQPVVGLFAGKPIAIAHNGNLTNVAELQKLVPQERRSTSMDSEYILRLLEAEDSEDIDVALPRVLRQLRGSFELVILMLDRMIAVRDPQGNHPLSIGRDGDGFFVSSESCAFPSLRARYVGDVEPGTYVTMTDFGVHNVARYASPDKKQCYFEKIYFSHPASRVFGENVARFRIRLGQKLEERCPVEGADLVAGIPDSANFIAMGFAQSGRSGTYFPAILRSHYVGRTFIAGLQAMRDEEASQKFAFSADEFRGKRIVIVDDSIVRGTTLPKVVDALRFIGAKEVHVRIGSPPITHPCTYGINTPTYDELIAHRLSPEQIRERVGADSLHFLPIEDLRSLAEKPEDYCYSCMTGKYW